MMSAACLRESALWSATDGPELAPAAAAHVQCCAACAARVVELQAVRRQLRAAAALDTGMEPGCDGPHHDGSRGATNSATAPAGRDAWTTYWSRQSSPPRRSPDSIGPYRVECLLRVGGQAEVFRARHPDLDVAIVVKWAHATWTKCPELADRFTEEARLLARLKHPCLPSVYDLGLAEHRPYLVLGYVNGSPLSRYGGRPLPARDAVRLTAKIARTLHAVHQAGRLHLDVQPDNILVDECGEPRLIDFGASLPIRNRSTRFPPHLTCGTPEYMPPEQQAGLAAQFDATTDVYALGAVLYELLTGTPPQPELFWNNAFHRETGGDPERRPPAALLRICRHALHPDPARRPATALAFARELERFAALRSRSVRLLLTASAFLWGGIAFAMLNDAAGRPKGFHQPASGADVRDQRHHRDLLVTELTDILQRAVDAQRTPLLVLADGRTLPLSLPRRSGDPSSNSADLVPSLLIQLLALPGVNLLVVGDNDVQRAATRDSRRANLLSVALPSLPPETAVRMNPQSVCLVEHTAAGPDDARGTARWRAVQVELSDMTPDFDALAFRTSAGGRRATSRAGTLRLNNAEAVSSP